MYNWWLFLCNLCDRRFKFIYKIWSLFCVFNLMNQDGCQIPAVLLDAGRKKNLQGPSSMVTGHNQSPSPFIFTRWQHLEAQPVTFKNFKWRAFSYAGHLWSNHRWRALSYARHLCSNHRWARCPMPVTYARIIGDGRCVTLVTYIGQRWWA